MACRVLDRMASVICCRAFFSASMASCALHCCSNLSSTELSSLSSTERQMQASPLILQDHLAVRHHGRHGNPVSQVNIKRPQAWPLVQAKSPHRPSLR